MKRRKGVQIIGLVMLALMVSGASGCTTIQGWLGQKSVGQALIVSGESLVFVSKQFEAAGTEFTARCAASAGTKRLSAETCNSFDKFGVKFKEMWPHVTGAWRGAVKARDAVLQKDSEKMANELYAELLTFVARLAAGLSFQPAHDHIGLSQRLALVGG